MCPDNRIPRGILREGGSAIKDGPLLMNFHFIYLIFL